MSKYAVAKFCRDMVMDIGRREQAQTDPAGALDAYDLTSLERKLLLSGDIGELYLQGYNGFLLSFLTRFNIFGLNPEIFSERMRGIADRVEPIVYPG
jgi:hypothetical protein